MDRRGGGPLERRRVPGGRARPADRDLRRAATLHPGLAAVPGRRHGTARGPGGRPAGGPAGLRHRAGEPAGRGPGGGPARPRRPGRRAGPGARGGPAGGGGQRRSRGPAPGPAGAHRARPERRSGACPQPGPGRAAGRRDLPVHERDHRDAQGGPAQRAATDARRRRRGDPPPADPGRPRLLLPPAVPRQRRGGRAAGDPGGPGLPGARPQVQPPRVLGGHRGQADHLDQRGAGDHHRAGHRPGRGTVTRPSASSGPRPLRCRRPCSGGSSGRSASRWSRRTG